MRGIINWSTRAGCDGMRGSFIASIIGSVIPNFLVSLCHRPQSGLSQRRGHKAKRHRWLFDGGCTDDVDMILRKVIGPELAFKWKLQKFGLDRWVNFCCLRARKIDHFEFKVNK